jgi:hypothetical protein
LIRLALSSASVAIAAGLIMGLVLTLMTNTVVLRWSIGDLTDPSVLGVVTLVLFVVGFSAVLWPASRAAMSQPATSLRTE